MIHIPLVTHGYIVNGKPALESVMERQVVTTPTKKAKSSMMRTMRNRNHA